jgi:hypothetical protein
MEAESNVSLRSRSSSPCPSCSSSRRSHRRTSRSPPRSYRRARSATPGRGRPPSPGNWGAPTPPLPSSPHFVPPVPMLPTWPSAPSRPRTPADMITYCHHDRMAYAPAAMSYDVRLLLCPHISFEPRLNSAPIQDAVSRAQAVFPSLAGIDPARLSLHVAGRDRDIRIPKISWANVLSDIERYEVIRVEVDDDAPPQYNAGGFHLHALARRPRSDSRAPTEAGRGLFRWAKGLMFCVPRAQRPRPQHSALIA